MLGWDVLGAEGEGRGKGMKGRRRDAVSRGCGV